MLTNHDDGTVTYVDEVDIPGGTLNVKVRFNPHGTDWDVIELDPQWDDETPHCPKCLMLAIDDALASDAANEWALARARAAYEQEKAEARAI